MRALPAQGWRRGPAQLGRLAAAAALVAALAGTAVAAEQLRFGTGPPGGVYQRIGAELERATARPGAVLLPVLARSSSGSVQNVHSLLRGDIDFAIVQANVLHAAVTGRAPFPRPVVSLRALGALFGEYVHIVARPDRGIETIADLAGRVVGIGAAGSGSAGLTMRVLKAHGVERFTRRSASPQETLARFRAGQIDAFCLVSGTPNAAVQGALDAGGRLVPVSRLKAGGLMNRAPYLALGRIEKDAYPGLAAAVPAVRVDAMLAATAEMRPETAYEILRLVFTKAAPAADGKAEAAGRAGGDFERLRQIVPDLRAPSKTAAEDLHAVPLHPGALAFYNERNVFPRPVKVFTGIYVNDLFNLDIAHGSYDADFYLWFRYRGRLVADPRDFRFEVMNGEVRHMDPPVVERFGGFTYLSYKVTGRFRASFPLNRFPFDAQVLPIEIEHPELEADEVEFVPDDTVGGAPRNRRRTMIEPGMAVGEWRIGDVRHRADVHVYRSDFGSPEAAPGAELRYSRYRFEVEIRRLLLSYLVKFCVPLILIVGVGFLVFFIPPEEFGVQVVVGIASLLSCVAFHTAQSDVLPHVGYMVTADLFFVVAYVTIFLGLLETVLEHWFFHRQRRDLAVRLDRIARFVIPGSFFGALALVIWSGT